MTRIKRTAKGTFAKGVCEHARSALGLPPGKVDDVIGKKVRRNIKAGEPVTAEALI